ncbi:Nucleolar protein 8 [Senna tora]|uniref:Nucleolar protein 8 n=1 Tax=Senna tora TaxID=362788 RepID=A0A834X2T0_9FABA|nr:Nucleolar protein 8 [Senna tora]
MGEGVTADDLRKLFGTLGSVDGVEMIRTKGRGFAYVDFTPSPTDQKSLAKLFSRYNGCLWKGGKLKLEKAKEHYLVRLKREWEEDAKLVSDQSAETSPDSDKSDSSKEMPSRESLKTKQLRIFFPKLRKVKSVPFLGTGKHKYSFPRVEVPPLPVHFCDCEEHSSPTSTVRGKQFYNEEPERGGMNDEEINIMNAVMNKLFEKEKISSPMQYEKEQKNSHESPDDLQSDEYVDSATDDDDDLIINVETKKKKTALIGSEELVRILGNQESGLKEARNFEEEANKNKLEVKKHTNIASDKKRKSLPNLEEKNNGCTTSTSGGKRHMQKLPDKTSSEVETTELGDGFREPTKVSWSQKSSWRELLGGNVAFNTSHILPSSNSSEEQGSDSSDAPESPNTKTQPSEEEQGSDSSDAPESPNTKTEPSEEEQGSESSDAPESPNTKTQPSEEEQGSDSSDAPESPNTKTQPSEDEQGSDSSDAPESPNTKTQPSEDEQGSDSSDAPESPITETEPMEMEGGPSKTEVMEEGLAVTQPTKKNVTSEQWGRGVAWKQKQSWTQLVAQHNSFSISQILPASTFQKSNTKEPIMNLAISSDCKQNDLAKDTNNECVGDDGLSLVKNTPEKKHNESIGDGLITPAPVIAEKCETEAKETHTRDITVSETCSFMRSAASLREWAKTKAAMSVSLKRKRTEKK